MVTKVPKLRNPQKREKGYLVGKKLQRKISALGSITNASVGEIFFKINPGIKFVKVQS